MQGTACSPSSSLYEAVRGCGFMWPFVGRTDEMQRLAVAASAALPGGVLLHGHAGVGKTRLLDEFVDHARVHGWAVERIAANPSTADVPMLTLTPISF